MTHSSQIEWDDSQANKQINSQTSTGRRSPNHSFSRKQAAQTHLRNQGRNYSCRRNNAEVKSRVLLSTAFRGGRQTSSGGAVIRHNRLIIPQVARHKSCVPLFFTLSSTQKLLQLERTHVVLLTNCWIKSLSTCWTQLQTCLNWTNGKYLFGWND